MTKKEDVLALAAAIRRADERGRMGVLLDAGSLLCLVSAVQLAARHPEAGGNFGLQQAVRLARELCGRAAARDAEFGRFLDAGWGPEEGGAK